VSAQYENKVTTAATHPRIGLPVALSIAACLFVLDLVFPFLRLTSPGLSKVVSYIAVWLPPAAAFSALRLVPFCERKWLRGSLWVVLGLLLTIFVSFGILVEAGKLFFPFDEIEERVTAKSVDGYQVVVYRYNCGAPCSLSLAVYQERTLLPGLNLVRFLDDYDPAAQANLEVIGENEVRVTVIPYHESPRQSQIFHLKRFIYF
jgi:hypothetical protein